MQLPEYDEYERIEVDHDEAHVLDLMATTQADEHFMTYEQEQAYIRSIDNHVNKIWTKKGQTQ